MQFVWDWFRWLYDTTGINLTIFYDAFDRGRFASGFQKVTVCRGVPCLQIGQPDARCARRLDPTLRLRGFGFAFALREVRAVLPKVCPLDRHLFPEKLCRADKRLLDFGAGRFRSDNSRA